MEEWTNEGTEETYAYFIVDFESPSSYPNYRVEWELSGKFFRKYMLR